MQKQKFDLGWEFTEMTGFAAMFNPRAWQPVILPHDAMIGKPRAESNPSGNQGGYFPGGVVNYRKKFFVPAEWRGQAVQLEFEGVYMNAEVTVNKQQAGYQPYGYSSFVIDLTPYLKYGEENVVGVVANNTAQPNSRWYSGTGIYRHVWLRMGGEARIPVWGVFVSTPVVSAQSAVVQVETELENTNSLTQTVLRSSVVDGDGRLVAQVETPAKTAWVQQSLLVDQPMLWSPDAPNLYTLRSEVLAADGQVIDSETTNFGIRSITVDAQRGLRLNSETIKMKGGCIHHDHGPLGAASYDRAEERKLELLKSAGYNAIRTAHNPPAPGLLDACDRLGMLVIDETFDAWFSPKVTNDYHLYFQEWWQRDTAAMIRRDRNHPSVIMWSIGNEIFESLGDPVGAEWSLRQADFVRALDSTRFVTSGIMLNFLEDIANHDPGASFQMRPVPEDPDKDSWARLTADFVAPLDVVGYNYMAQRYAADQQRFPQRVIAGTETWGHKMYIFWQETLRNPNTIGDFVWTALDYLGEAGGGFVNYEGKVSMGGGPFPYHTSGIGDFNICGFKRPQSYYRDLLWGVRSDPFIAVHDPQHFGQPLGFSPWAWEPVLDTWTFPGQEGQPVQVDVYSIDDEIELLINGQPVGRKPAGVAVQNKVSFETTYQPGVIEAVGYRDGKPAGRCHLVTSGSPLALCLTPDRAQIQAGGGDLSFITIEVQDAEGELVRHCEPSIQVEVSGAGELIALGSGNPWAEELYGGSTFRAFEGRLLAVVRSGLQPGPVTVTARSAGLPAVSIALEAKQSPGSDCASGAMAIPQAG